MSGRDSMPIELAVALDEHPDAHAVFEALAPQDRSRFVDHVAAGGSADERAHRASETVRLIHSSESGT